MFRILGEIPHEIGIALSGGPDSMAIADFLLRGKKKVTAFYFNHGTLHGSEAEKFVVDWCLKRNVQLVIGHLTSERNAKKSPEEFWRDERYAFLQSQNQFQCFLGQ